MDNSILRRLTSWGGAVALCLGHVATAPAQDGQAPVVPPATGAPGTTQAPVVPPAPRNPANNQAPPGTTNRPRNTSEVLPAVPETASDPAPPGTRGVRVDVPRGGAPAAPVSRPGDAAQRRPSNVLMAEGVVTRLDRAGKNLNGELERFAFDPSQDWYSYINRGAQGVAEKDAERPKGNEEIKDANEKQHEEDPDKPKVMEMVITKRTYVYTHARSADGTDQYGASTSSSPEPTSSRTGLTNRVNAAPAAGPMLTNFTNLKEGSFVAVRYRKVGDLNEVLNLTLIEMPLNPIDAGAPAPSPGATSGPARGTNSDPTPAPTGTTGTGTTGTGTTGTRTGTTGTGTTVTGTTGTTPAERVPTVPTTPAGAALPR